jgi:putative flippase GtrA
MSAVMFGLACALPISLLIGMRYYVFRHRMDGQAKRSYARMAALFLLATVIATAFLFAIRGIFPLPAVWELALAGVTAGLLVGIIPRN